MIDDYGDWAAAEAERMDDGDPYGEWLASNEPWEPTTPDELAEVYADQVAHDASQNPLVRNIVKACLVVLARGGADAEILRPALSPLMTHDVAAAF